MDRLVSMQAFVQVVDSGSFAGAAKRLAASPAAVTHHVQALEDRLGVQLLNRTTRKLNLTEVGRTFYQHSARILAQVEEAERSATLLQTTPRGLLRLNTSEGIARVVMPLIAEFSEAYPEMAFDVVLTDRMADMVEEGFDLALRAGPLPDSTLISRKLGLGRLTLCAAPDYVARCGAPQRPEDLSSHNCLIYHMLGNEWRFTSRAGAVAVAVSGNLRSNSLEAVRRAALSGQGIGLLAAIVVAEDLQNGALVQLLPGYEVNEVVIQAVYPASRHVSVKIRSFLDFLVKRLHDRAGALGAAAGGIPEITA
jgi:DNA-binding transcriptional LysR family regulator